MGWGRGTQAYVLSLGQSTHKWTGTKDTGTVAGCLRDGGLPLEWKAPHPSRFHFPSVIYHGNWALSYQKQLYPNLCRCTGLTPSALA